MVVPKRLDRADIAHVARLAALSLSLEEMDKMTVEVDAILRYVDELATVNTEGIEPTAHLQNEGAGWREDIVAPSLSREEAIGQAPRSSEGKFAVPVFVVESRRGRT